VKRRPIGIGIIGGGLMGREIASAFARWRALIDAAQSFLSFLGRNARFN
jgi:3-hydroxyacyl-CoA dehydrogenase